MKEEKEKANTKDVEKQLRGGINLDPARKEKKEENILIERRVHETMRDLLGSSGEGTHVKKGKKGPSCGGCTDPCPQEGRGGRKGFMSAQKKIRRIMRGKGYRTGGETRPNGRDPLGEKSTPLNLRSKKGKTASKKKFLKQPSHEIDGNHGTPIFEKKMLKGKSSG